ncbi:MAG: flagellar biosynthetic protein FliR [Tepidisphaeraceae bacterium]
MDAAELELMRLAPAYLPALLRVGAVLAVAPPFASVAVPRRMRVLLAMGLTLGLMPVGVIPQQPASAGQWIIGQWIIGLGGEMLIGLAMGLALGMVFAAARIAGELVANQMGLSLPEVYDPAGGGGGGAGGQGTAMGQAYGLIAVIVFFAMNGHHAMLQAVATSFSTVPMMTTAQSPAAAGLLAGLLQSATVLALKLAAPVFVATLIADLAMGMVARTVPQLGVMTAGITVRAIAGLLVMLAAIAMTVAAMQGAFAGIGQSMAGLFAGR